MDVIAICGSPRQGNTEFILKRLLMKAEGAGHKTELVLLREKKIGYCMGCLGCDQSGACPISDDMDAILASMEKSDLIIFASPNYYNNVSGIMKVFFDRMNVLYGTDKLSGKKVSVIFVGEEVKTIQKAILSVESIANSFGMDIVCSLYLNGKGPRDIETNPESVQKIDDFAKIFLS